ncbi:hypothetical protein SAMN05444722_0334 [Rhodovulum sp. ES.010]|uniref:hypothetical protein n=1 Tax=Rhodovulum sp. ES.010 TaxID=1882821 RepID=UPI00092B2FCC|nr:hypothetical protein [Rhodovulum sp. ES.010]SIO07751.1 hypothetical protein SAMN05444722_0334 [Rhodovulum sp. ES.010]
MAEQNYDVIVPESASKWIGLVAGLLLPLFIGVVGAQIYGTISSQGGEQVYPLPEE